MDRTHRGILAPFPDSEASGEPVGMNPTEPDPNKPSDAAQPRVGDLARVGGAPRSERWFRSLVENSSDVITILEADGTIRYVSPAVRSMLGYKPEELIGTDVFNLIHPDDLERKLGILAEVLETSGLRQPLGFRVPHRDGFWRYMEHVVHNMLDDPDVAGVVINSRDITERKRYEEALRESEERFRSSFEDAAIGMALVVTDGRFLRVNRSLCRIVGYEEEELLEKTFQEITHPDDLEADLEQVRRMLAGEIETYQQEKRYIHREGHAVWILLSASLVRNEAVEPLYFISQIQDITERKLAEEALRESERRLQTIVGNAPVVLFALDREGVFTLSEGQGLGALGIRPGEVVGRSVFEVYRDMPEIHRHVRRTLGGEEVVAVAEVGDLAFDVVYGPVRDEDGEVVGVIGVAADVTRRKQAEERLEYQALHDPLTDLPNRKLFVDRLEQALSRTSRRRGRKVGVLFMDLDSFKVVNDSLGHEVGDRVLQLVAERLEGHLRPEDTLARFGGDEFAVLIEDLREPADAVRVAERLAEALREPLVLAGQELFVKPSIGIALGTSRTKSPEDLLRDADTAMHRAKAGDSGYHQVFEPVMYEQALRRLKMENDIRRAIESEEFVVHYQPIVDLRGDGVWGVEALVRWRHPERGLLDPKEFIPVAEESSLVVPMGEGVLRQACEQAKLWQERYPRVPPLVIAVNLSARQLGRSDLARTIAGVLRETGLDAGSLSLDVTETVYAKTLEGNTAVLNELKRLGVKISIDDFGTGYSSLSYLKRFPADTLKIDRSFIGALGEDVEDTVIVQMILDLAHAFGMEVIAEGVESAAQLESLRSMGCDFVQGYHLAKPLPPEGVPAFLKE